MMIDADNGPIQDTDMKSPGRISTISGLEKIAEWAFCHHEKPDGSGYPCHYGAGQLDTGDRIVMVADIFTALSEDRLYRKSMPKDEVIRIFRGLSDKPRLHALGSIEIRE